LMAEPNVLLLDEPTNDLDIDTLQELESLLDGWPGTMVVISHDRYLIERVTDSTWALFGDGKLTNLPGGIEEYPQRRAAMAAAEDSGVLNLGAATQAGTFSAATEQAATSVESSGISSQERHRITKEMNALERKMGKLD